LNKKISYRVKLKEIRRLGVSKMLHLNLGTLSTSTLNIKTIQETIFCTYQTTTTQRQP